MISCKICGHSVKYRLIEHIQKIHKISLDEYFEKYGPYVSDEYIEKVSITSKKVWKEFPGYRDSIISKRKITQNTPEWKKKQSDTIKKVYERGFKNWNCGLTKNDNEILKRVGEKNKIHLTGRNKENYEYLMKHSNKMKNMWKRETNLTYPSRCLSEEKLEIWKNKIRESVTNKILSGELNTKSHFKYGWYISTKGEKYWYCSKLELDAMIFLDSISIYWTNKHKIRIEYIRSDNTVHNYIPDFKIIYNNVVYIIEMKGYPDEDIKEKEFFTKIIYNYKICYSITELENYINEIIKNK